MPLLARFEFVPTPRPLTAISFARLFCDLQHVSATMMALPVVGQIPQRDVMFRPRAWKYSFVIELSHGELGSYEVFIPRVKQTSPLWVEVLMKVPKEVASKVAKAFRIAFQRVSYGDIEREKRLVEVDIMREERLKKRIENLAATYRLAQEIHDDEAREIFLQGLEFSLRPFFEEHPPIKKIKFSIVDDAAPDTELPSELPPRLPPHREPGPPDAGHTV